MGYREFAPPSPLAPFVACFWEVTGGAAPAVGRRILPDGAMDLLFARGNAASRVIGPMTRAIVAPPDREWTVGVRFRPGAAIEMLGVAARELVDDAALAREVWGASGRSLDERLAEARHPTTARAALTAAVLARSRRARMPDARLERAIATLRMACGELPLTAVAASSGVGERQLERLFAERVGHGPKLFARVVRLERAVAALSPAPRVRGSSTSWATLARAFGYADQAHLIREFRALTGVTPRVYVAERAMSEIDNPGYPPIATVRA
jgi:AraC-like DNA-binding protein